MVVSHCDLVDRLQSISDPRRQCLNLKHRLDDILVLGFCGVLAGADDFVEMAAFARINLAFFQTFLELPNGIPSHDTLNRVFSSLRPTLLQAVLLPWLLERRDLPDEAIHVDGKTMRGTRCDAKKLGALHVVSAWAGQSGLTLGQVAVDGKSNEITAMPQLLALLDLREKIVTVDAMGCQKDVARTIVEGDGDYVLAVKDNQPTLHAEIQQVFVKAAAKPRYAYPEYVTSESGHGRQEQRTVRVLPAARQLSPKVRAAWPGLLTLVMVVRVVTCRATGTVSREESYYISSLKANAYRIGQAVRGHWSIENGLHWVLDVVFREDGRKLYDRTAAENVALLNRLALSLLRGDTSEGSLKEKRKQAGWHIPYLAQLLGFSGV